MASSQSAMEACVTAVDAKQWYKDKWAKREEILKRISKRKSHFVNMRGTADLDNDLNELEIAFMQQIFANGIFADVIYSIWDELKNEKNEETESDFISEVDLKMKLLIGEPLAGAVDKINRSSPPVIVPEFNEYVKNPLDTLHKISKAIESSANVASTQKASG